MKKHRALVGVAAIIMNQGLSTTALALDQDLILRRLEALEKENSALKQRLNRVEQIAPKQEKYAHQNQKNNSVVRETRESLGPNMDRDLDSPNISQAALSSFAVENPNSAAYAQRHYELSGSLLILQPGAGNLTYGAATSPYPLPTPNWNDQSIQTNYQPTFNIGLRYMLNPSNDIDVNWTHLETSSTASFAVNPVTQFAGPHFYIGPQGGNYGNGKGKTWFGYDAVNVEVGHTFCADCSFQFRPFAGVEYANFSNFMTGTFSNATGAQTHTAGLNLISNTTTSKFSGAGPRAGFNASYNWNDFQILSKIGAGLLVGAGQSNINVLTTCTDGCPGNIAIVGNPQSWTSPSRTQVVPTVDAKLGAAYTFAPTSYGQLKIEAGYQAAVYFNVVNQYHLTNVPPSLEAQTPTGIYLSTAQRTQNDFTVQGPYLTAKWAY